MSEARVCLWFEPLCCLAGKEDVPASAVTRPICGLLGTIRLVAGRWHCGTVALGPVRPPGSCFGANWSAGGGIARRHVPDRHHQEAQRRQPDGSRRVEGRGF